jgi:hypothetical protein
LGKSWWTTRSNVSINSFSLSIGADSQACSSRIPRSTIPVDGNLYVHRVPETAGTDDLSVRLVLITRVRTLESAFFHPR